MMRMVVSALVFALATTTVPAMAGAQTAPAATTPAPTAPAKYTVADTDVGTLLDDPASKAILAKYLPELVNSDQISMARSMTLESMQTYAPDKLTDDKLKQINADLAKLPVKK